MSSSQGEAKTRFIDLLSGFLHKFRIAFLVILAILLVVVVAYFVWSELQNAARAKAALWAENAQDLYQKWLGEPDQTKKQATAKDLDELLQRILARYPRQYGAQRAELIKASMAYELKDWAKAADDYMTLARRFPRSYLAPLGLLYGGVCYEEQGDAQKAFAAYEQLVSRYRDSYLRPRALFDLGRMREQAGDFAGAKKAYDQMEEEYPLSNWTKAARNRIIELGIEGKISE